MTTRGSVCVNRALVRLDHVITDQGRARDAELAAQVAEGKRDALEQVYNQVGGAVKTTAWRVLRDEALAEDVVQEVFMTFWRQPERYDESRGSLRVFLVTMAHRKAVDIVRSESARLKREERDPSPVQPDIEEEVWALAVGDKVRTALLELGEGTSSDLTCLSRRPELRDVANLGAGRHREESDSIRNEEAVGVADRGETDMTHDQTNILLPLYAIDSLTPNETLEVESHLHTCPECRHELDSYHAAAALVPMGAPPPFGPVPIRSIRRWHLSPR
jgi:RNA polymerase sigma factor (sigma-70 family)